MEQHGEREILFASPSNGGIINKVPHRALTRQKAQWTKILLLAGFATTVGCSLSVGYHIGVVNAPADKIKQFCNESFSTRFQVDISKSQLEFLWASIVAIFLIGGCTGSLGGSYLADRFGRKGGLIISSILGAIGGVLFFSSKPANSVEMLIIGRLLVGLSSGLITSVMPMYLTEISPLELRGSMGVLCPLGVTVGVLLGQIISLNELLGTSELWPYCLSAFLIPLISCSIIVPFLPESPKYLFVIKKQPDLALDELSKIRSVGRDKLECEIEELRAEERDNDLNENAWTLKQVLTDRTLRLPLLLVCSLQAGQQFSGINAVFYYSVSIFENAGLSHENSQLGTIGAGICNLFMAVISIPIMARFNRRTIIQWSLSTTAFFLFLLFLAITYIKSFTWMPYLCIIGVLGFVLCYGLGLGPIPYFVGSELFEVGPRPSAMALGSLSNWAGNFVIGQFFPLMQSSIGAASFFIFGLIVVLLLAFIRFYLPETRGRDVSEIAMVCRKGFASKPLKSPVSSTSDTTDSKIESI